MWAVATLRRSARCLTLALCGLGISMLADAQPSVKMYRIGWLSNVRLRHPTPIRGIGDFLQGLRDLGLVEGKDVTVESRFADGNVERLPELVAELARLKVDVIVTSGEPAALAAKRATKCDSLSLRRSSRSIRSSPGLVASLARPEGNVTGLTSISEELWQKRLELLKALVPKLTRLAVLWNPANPVCLLPGRDSHSGHCNGRATSSAGGPGCEMDCNARLPILRGSLPTRSVCAGTA